MSNVQELPWQIKMIAVGNLALSIVSVLGWLKFNNFVQEHPQAETAMAAVGFFMLMTIFYLVSVIGTLTYRTWARKLNYFLSAVGIWVSLIGIMGNLLDKKMLWVFLFVILVAYSIFVIRFFMQSTLFSKNVTTKK